MKKRIGILTFHFSNHNYGALLQTYASVAMLRERGFEPTVINLMPEEYSPIKSSTSLIGYLLFVNPFGKFRKKFIPLTKEIKSEKDLTDLNNQFDFFYVGSDQVWRQEFALENYYHYFLDFVNSNKIKISYAASFGKDFLDIDVATKCNVKKLLDNFLAISVREDSGVDICRSEFDIQAEKVLDPTLLLSKNDYDLIIHSEYHKKIKHKYIAYYQLTHTVGESVDALQMSKWLNRPLENIYRKSINLGFKTFTPYSSFPQWLYKIRESDFVVTDSYHCMIFAIIYRKDFVIFGNNFGGNSRIISLLESLNLKDRHLEDVNEDIIKKITPINYNIVFEKLEILKSQSMNFLSKLS